MWLTWRVFARVDADTFTRRMAVRRATRRAGMQRLLPHGDGPSFAISSSLIAFTVVLVIPHVEAIRVEDWLLVIISLTILFACWGLSVLSYALHYEQYDLDEPGLEFAGRRTRAFEDYLYFAIGVATTLGATDVNVTTQRCAAPSTSTSSSHSCSIPSSSRCSCRSSSADQPTSPPTPRTWTTLT